MHSSCYVLYVIYIDTYTCVHKYIYIWVCVSICVINTKGYINESMCMYNIDSYARL